MGEYLASQAPLSCAVAIDLFAHGLVEMQRALSRLLFFPCPFLPFIILYSAILALIDDFPASVDSGICDTF